MEDSASNYEIVSTSSKESNSNHIDNDNNTSMIPRRIPKEPKEEEEEGVVEQEQEKDSKIKLENEEEASTMNVAVQAPSNTMEMKTKTRATVKWNDIHANDVLCGRGHGVNDHTGNVQYRKIITSKREEFLSVTDKVSKRAIATTIVNTVRAMTPPGRFLKKMTEENNDDDDDVDVDDTTTSLWFDIGDEKARGKTSQGLREGTSNNSNSSSNSAHIAPTSVVSHRTASLQLKGDVLVLKLRVHYDLYKEAESSKDDADNNHDMGPSTKTKVVLNKHYSKDKDGCWFIPTETLELIDDDDDPIEDAQFSGVTKGSSIIYKDEQYKFDELTPFDVETNIKTGVIVTAPASVSHLTIDTTASPAGTTAPSRVGTKAVPNNSPSSSTPAGFANNNAVTPQSMSTLSTPTGGLSLLASSSGMLLDGEYHRHHHPSPFFSSASSSTDNKRSRLAGAATPTNRTTWGENAGAGIGGNHLVPPQTPMQMVQQQQMSAAAHAAQAHNTAVAAAAINCHHHHMNNYPPYHPSPFYPLSAAAAVMEAAAAASNQQNGGRGGVTPPSSRSLSSIAIAAAGTAQRRYPTSSPTSKASKAAAAIAAAKATPTAAVSAVINISNDVIIRCVPMTPPIPTKYQGGGRNGDDDMLMDETAQIPEFSRLVNYPNHISTERDMYNSAQQQLPDGMRRCVMCNTACFYGVSAAGHKKHIKNVASPSATKNNININNKRPRTKKYNDVDINMSSNANHGGAIIPSQNKGLCTVCDVNVWIIGNCPTDTRLEGKQIKWCKGCKNFKLWSSFGDKGHATKCMTCRDRQKEKYALQKAALSISKLGGTRSGNNGGGTSSSSSTGTKGKKVTRAII